MLNFSKFFQNLFIVHIPEHFLSAFQKLFQNFPSCFQNFIKFLRNSPFPYRSSKIFLGSLFHNTCYLDLKVSSGSPQPNGDEVPFFLM